MKFSGSNKFVLHGFATINNMDLTGDKNSTFELAGLTTTVASAKGQHDNIGVQFVIDAGATLNDLSNNALTFTTTNLTLTVNGTMYVDFGPNPTNTLIDGQGNANDYVNVAGGTLKYTGQAGTTDTFTVPVEVQGSGVQFSGGKFQVSAGKLVVQNAVGATQGASVYMTGSNSKVFLSQSSTLECDGGYVQDGGTLASMDATTCTLQVGAGGAGTADINGGTLGVNSTDGISAQSSGEFDVKGNLAFAGKYVVGIQGNNSGQQGLLKVTGNMNLNAGNSLSVTVTGPLNNGMWTIIDTGGNNIAQFAANNLPVGLTDHNNKPVNGDYQLTSP